MLHLVQARFHAIQKLIAGLVAAAIILRREILYGVSNVQIIIKLQDGILRRDHFRFASQRYLRSVLQSDGREGKSD